MEIVNTTTCIWPYWVGYLVVSVVCGIQVKIDCNVRAEASQTPIMAAANREGNDSSGDSTRSMFYRLLLFALISRILLIPTEGIVGSDYWKFVAKTLPEMTFASAWTLLVSFLVQLVGTASGTGIYTQPSLIIQMIAYGIYLVLTLVALHTHNAFVSVYAVLCFIYTILFGALLYFGPRLVLILYPSLIHRSSLAIRLICSCIICVLIFAAQAVELARKVFSPPDDDSALIEYLLLELFPTVALLVMMFPSSRMQQQKSLIGSDNIVNGKEVSAFIDGSSKRKETLTIVKHTPWYGTV